MLQQVRHGGGGGRDLLEVVEDQQDVLVVQLVTQSSKSDSAAVASKPIALAMDATTASLSRAAERSTKYAPSSNRSS